MTYFICRPRLAQKIYQGRWKYDYRKHKYFYGSLYREDAGNFCAARPGMKKCKPIRMNSWMDCLRTIHRSRKNCRRTIRMLLSGAEQEINGWYSARSCTIMDFMTIWLTIRNSVATQADMTYERILVAFGRKEVWVLTVVEELNYFGIAIVVQKRRLHPLLRLYYIKAGPSLWGYSICGGLLFL